VLCQLAYRVAWASHCAWSVSTEAYTEPGQNRLLTGLPRQVRQRLAPDLEKVPLAFKQLLYDADQPIEHVFFPIGGVISLLITMEDRRIIEVGTIGNEGFVGTPLFLGADRSPTRVICQVPGEGFRLTASAFKRHVEQEDSLRDLIQRYTQAMVNQISQSVACNHLHSIEERMCRWLLMTHDRVGVDRFQLSQEFLSQMLGVRRPSVTIAAGMLQKAGLITYRRGMMTVLDRNGLEQGACECYRVVRNEFDRLLKPAGSDLKAT